MRKQWNKCCTDISLKYFCILRLTPTEMAVLTMKGQAKGVDKNDTDILNLNWLFFLISHSHNGDKI